MEELLKALEQLYAQEITDVVSSGGYDLYFKNNELRREAENLCDEYLIGPFGECNWDNINKLKIRGYDVYPGERDSYGWVTGCVRKHGDRRVLIYG